MALGVLAGLWGEAWLLRSLIYWVLVWSPSGSCWRSLGFTARMMLVPSVATWVSFSILGCVVLSANLLRFWLRWTGAPRGMVSARRS